MDLLVRPARPEDPCVPLLFESARPYYTAYAGSAKRALALLEAVYTEPGHAASYDCCRVALAGGELVGVVAGFPVTKAISARGASSGSRCPSSRPGAGRGRSGTCAPPGASLPARPPTRTTSTRWRSPTDGAGAGSRGGCSTRRASRPAAPGCRGSRSTPGCTTTPRAALYEAYGFGEREIRRAGDARTARALGGPGFVGYLMAV